jgi:hypothetical protein
MYTSTNYNPNLMSVFHCLGRLSRESAQVWGALMTFITNLFVFDEGLLVPCPTPKLEDDPLSIVSGYLFNIFAASPHSLRAFLHPQTEDAPCWCDREPT